MKHQIIVDSCCDHSDEIKEKLNAQVIPLTMRLGTKEFIDDELLDLEQFMLEMGMCEEAAGSASPPPVAYQAAFEQDMTCLHCPIF